MTQFWQTSRYQKPQCIIGNGTLIHSGWDLFNEFYRISPPKKTFPRISPCSNIFRPSPSSIPIYGILPGSPSKKIPNLRLPRLDHHPVGLMPFRIDQGMFQTYRMTLQIPHRPTEKFAEKCLKCSKDGVNGKTRFFWVLGEVHPRYRSTG